MKKILVNFSFFCIISATSFASKDTTKITKSFGFGLNGSYSLLGYSNSNNISRLPGLITSPYLFISINRHEINLGTDIYRGTWIDNNLLANKIYGLAFNYKYFLLKNNPKFNLFVECAIQYVQFGEGLAGPVTYNYLPTSKDNVFYNLIRTKSFVNTFGGGLRYVFFKRLGIQFELLGGYKLYNSDYSPTNPNHNNMWHGIEKITAPTVIAKFGLFIKMSK